ncbi:MAG: hypothetical protein R8P61_30235 [Bacteroidia bacterium]|nr:hypothetical protein [Bacteroidia bacterium]
MIIALKVHVSGKAPSFRLDKHHKFIFPRTAQLSVFSGAFGHFEDGLCGGLCAEKSCTKWMPVIHDLSALQALTLSNFEMTGPLVISRMGCAEDCVPRNPVPNGLQ